MLGMFFFLYFFIMIYSYLRRQPHPPMMTMMTTNVNRKERAGKGRRPLTTNIGHHDDDHTMITIQSAQEAGLIFQVVLTLLFLVISLGLTHFPCDLILFVFTTYLSIWVLMANLPFT